MEVILTFIIVLQFGYIIFKDIKSAKEHELMLIKLMSKDIREYKDALEPPAENAVQVSDDEHIPIEMASVEQILKAKQ